MVIPIGVYVYSNTVYLMGYQNPAATFYSLESYQKGFSYTVGDPTPDFSAANGVWSWASKRFHWDMENYETLFTSDSEGNTMDLIGSLSLMKKDLPLHIPSMWGIPDTYERETVIDGKEVTIVTKLSLWTYTLKMTLTGMPDGRQCTGSATQWVYRSWEPVFPLTGVNVGIRLNMNNGIVSNANRSYAIPLLVMTSAYETNDGDHIDIGTPWFPGHTAEDVVAIANPPGTGVALEMTSINTSSMVGTTDENSLGALIEGATWIDNETAIEMADVYFITGVTKFQCAAFYDWDGRQGPIKLIWPQIELTFQIHILGVGQMIFEVPIEELPDYDIDIDLYDEAGFAGFWDWLWTLLYIVVILIVVVVVAWVLVSFLRRPKVTTNIYTGGAPREHPQSKPTKPKKKTKWRFK